MTHANARLTPHGRRLLVDRVIRDGRPVAHVATELGVSRQCAHRWVARFRAEGASLGSSTGPHARAAVRDGPPHLLNKRFWHCDGTSGEGRTGSDPSSASHRGRWRRSCAATTCRTCVSATRSPVT